MATYEEKQKLKEWEEYRRDIECATPVARTDNFQKDRYSFVIVNRKNGKTTPFYTQSLL